MMLIFTRAAAVIFLISALIAPATAGPYEDAHEAEQRDDYATAIPIYRSLAERGNAAAMKRLGFLHEIGVGVKQDWVEAAKWYYKAFEAGDESAGISLGGIGRRIRGLISHQSERYRRAAEQGDADAQVALGIAYENGSGVPQDYVEAHKWYNLASPRFRYGEFRTRTNKMRDALALKMTASQIAEAQKLAREWKQSKQSP